MWLWLQRFRPLTTGRFKDDMESLKHVSAGSFEQSRRARRGYLSVPAGTLREHRAQSRAEGRSEKGGRTSPGSFFPLKVTGKGMGVCQTQKSNLWADLHLNLERWKWFTLLTKGDNPVLPSSWQMLIQSCSEGAGQIFLIRETLFPPSSPQAGLGWGSPSSLPPHHLACPHYKFISRLFLQRVQQIFVERLPHITLCLLSVRPLDSLSEGKAWPPPAPGGLRLAWSVDLLSSHDSYSVNDRGPQSFALFFDDSEGSSRLP